MSTRRRAGRVRATYAFIHAHHEQFPVQVMCRLLEVAPSGYYGWCHPHSHRVLPNLSLDSRSLISHACPICDVEYATANAPVVVDP